MTRADVKAIVGGGLQGGIIPADKHIILYSDHAGGARHGYYDGWLADEGSNDPLFEYTGTGRNGDQRFVGPNKAVLNHVAAKRTIHIFSAIGVVAGTQTKTHHYLGQFVLDEEQPYLMRRAPGEDGIPRWVIVFRLRPVNRVVREDRDDIPPARVTEATPVPADVTESRLVRPEVNTRTATQRVAVPRLEVQRREARLSDAYTAYLEGKGHSVQRFQIRVQGLRSTLLTDIYDATEAVLYEAKSTVSREDIRMAVGQLLDYRRHITVAGLTLAVLLPSKPNRDLQDYLQSLNIRIICRYEGGFAEI
ncbi:hypothetical protein [Spongiactinospora sp. TRM90649]|uniref:hypothetical protein n=1 Tax=Spongiactinospora sp. TRM90649 TaxID=3031114 RepID=UPI0023F64D04|nr:hypothetical protein [Spongiactinospora sp. TRM90649]MDF5753643.1 hypothetical protein [Spongiactinospora sp. TRM90649]